MNSRTLTTHDLEAIRTLWNEEMPHTFFLRKDLFKSQIATSQDMDWSSSFVAFEGQKLVGSILVKAWKRNVLDAYQKTAWITFIHVAKSYQHQGIGRTLIEHAIENLRTQGVHTIHLGKSMNNFFCGVPETFEANRFFETIGFVENDRPVDMHKHITNHSMIPLRHKIGYSIRISTTDDFTKMRDFFIKNFPGRWYQEFEEYVASGYNGSEFAIIEINQRVVAFCRINQSLQSMNMYNTNFTNDFSNLYGVGPLGVDEDFRSYSLGFDITAFAINQAVQNGATDIIIDWTSHIAFYEKFGFKVWNRYISMKYTV